MVLELALVIFVGPFQFGIFCCCFIKCRENYRTLYVDLQELPDTLEHHTEKVKHSVVRKAFLMGMKLVGS